MTLFNHLISGELPFDDDEEPQEPSQAPQTLESIPVPDLVAAQARTASWLEELGAVTGDARAANPDLTLDEEAAAAARNAFCSVTNPYVDPFEAKSALMALTAPAPVRHLAGMLSKYDESFIAEAGKIRGYIVSKLMEHAQSKDAKVSLAALKTLGTVTEIGAYTERIEIARPASEGTAEALVEKLRKRLESFLPRQMPPPPALESAGEVVDATLVVPTPETTPQPETASP